MSFHTLYCEVLLDKDQLLNLLLGQGSLQLHLGDPKPVTIQEFSDRHCLRKVDGIAIHEVKFCALSDDPNLSNIDGKATIIPSRNNETFVCKLEVHFQDHFE